MANKKASPTNRLSICDSGIAKDEMRQLQELVTGLGVRKSRMDLLRLMS